MHPRILALAGLLQALKLVRQIADTGHADAGNERVVFDSVFRIDADSAAEIYGGELAVRPGLLLLRELLVDRGADEAVSKLAMAILQVERRFVEDETMTASVLSGVRRLQDAAQRQGSIHPDVIGGLGQLYADTISQLRPRVIVQGNPHYLQQPQVVAEIRALLLAALRSAVLWRQMGGTMWDFFLRRRPMMAAAEDALGG